MPRDSLFGAGRLGRKSMKKTIAALGFAAVIGFAFCQSAQAQYSEHRVGKGKIVKCYRDFVIGKYACHVYTYW
jgi:hypothetical protein